MAEYLDWVLLSLALVVNFTMIGICAIFYFCWSKVFWREKRSFATPEKTDIEKTKYQPSLLKKDLEAAQYEVYSTSGPYYIVS